MISNESFFEPIKKQISNLKLRASYGIVGNDAIGDTNDRFFYMSNVNLNDWNYGYAFGTDWRYMVPAFPYLDMPTTRLDGRNPAN